MLGLYEEVDVVEVFDKSLVEGCKVSQFRLCDLSDLVLQVIIGKVVTSPFGDREVF